MVSILGLDCSKSCGFAFFKSAEAKPLCGTWVARDSWLSDQYGGYFDEFEKWLDDRITVFKPEVLAFESPLLLQRHKGRGTDEQQIRRLVGVVSIAEKLAHQRSIPCHEVNVQTAKAMFDIPGRRPEGMSKGEYKDLMLLAMTNLGVACADSHQADAAALSLVVYDSLGEA